MNLKDVEVRRTLQGDKVAVKGNPEITLTLVRVIAEGEDALHLIDRETRKFDVILTQAMADRLTPVKPNQAGAKWELDCGRQ